MQRNTVILLTIALIAAVVGSHDLDVPVTFMGTTP
jgi:hypothetical protein